MTARHAWLAQHSPAGIAPPEISDVTFRPGWLRNAHIDALRQERAIDQETYDVALGFRTLVERAAGYGHSSLMGTPGGTTGSSSGLHDAAISQATAESRVRLILVRLAGLDGALVWACVILDLSWRALGERLAVEHRTAKRWTIAALGRLPAAVAAAELAWRYSPRRRSQKPPSPP